MHRSIVGFHQDLEEHWVAELDCGHCQHTRHEPPHRTPPLGDYSRGAIRAYWANTQLRFM